MATNRPYELDEAMHRRINIVLEYREPDYEMRKRIWDNHLGNPYTVFWKCNKSCLCVYCVGIVRGANATGEFVRHLMNCLSKLFIV